MSFTYVIDRERRLVLSTISGELTMGDIVGHQTALTQDAAFNPTFNQLADFTQVKKVSLSSEEIRTAASRSIFSRGSRRAFVAPTAELFGLSRMFEAYRALEGGEEVLQVFKDKGEALRWLLKGSKAGQC